MEVNSTAIQDVILSVLKEHPGLGPVALSEQVAFEWHKKTGEYNKPNHSAVMGELMALVARGEVQITVDRRVKLG